VNDTHGAAAPSGVEKAIDSIYDYTKVLITLATGTIALSATLLTRQTLQYEGWLELAWIGLGISMLAGLWAMGQYITMYLDGNVVKEKIPRASNGIQLVALIAGIAFLAAFALQNISLSSPPATTPTSTTIPATPSS
jgi:hypothetical protein